MAVRVILNQKGGVGKSTLTVNLAAVTAAATQHEDAEHSVLAVSVDPQGSAMWWAERVADMGELPFMISQEEDPKVLRGLRDIPNVSNVFVDTPGWIGADSKGEETQDTKQTKELISTLIDSADLVVVPITTEGLSFIPTERTIEEIVKPSGKPYVVVITLWEPRDGRRDLEQTQEYVRRQGWPMAKTVIRRYKIHARAAVEGRVVTDYPRNRVALEAKSDFTDLALELASGTW